VQFAAIGVAVLSLLIWLYLFFFNGHFWQIWIADADGRAIRPLERWPGVLAIVPARNEAASIEETVRSLMQQAYPGNFSITVVDDHSDDGTGDLARKAAADSGAPVEVLEAPQLLAGWTGKLWALQAGIDAAAAKRVDFFWFTDADVVHGPETLTQLVSRAEHEAYDLTSLMVLLRAETFAEKLVIPPFLYFFLMLYPPRWIADPNAKTAGAAGGCILLRRNVLAPIHGLASIRAEVIDDCALARAVKKNGGKIWMGLTRTSVSLRGYGTFAEIRNMIARTAFTQLRYSILLLVLALAGLFVTFLLPWFSFFAGDDPAWFLASTAICLMTVTFGVTVRFYGLPWPWALTLPFAAVYYGYATCVSAVRYYLGRGGQWKGRAQAPRGN